MERERQFGFGAFRVDVRTGQLWRGTDELKLTPRAASVLHLLAERAQQIVTKQELFDRVWRGIAITDDALTSCIQELRRALGDDARRPHLIETRHRRGYRLMVPAIRFGDPSTAPAEPTAADRLVGRADALEELARGFARARSGRRQIVFVTGEPGIGKSALADAFLEQLKAGHAVNIAHGQCLDHHGAGEPFLPLIEALTRLASRDGAIVKDLLSRHAPSWVAQMPSLRSPSAGTVSEARTPATRARMLRELTLAIEAITSKVPLVLKLEDIHWSDVSTIDWLAHAARRSEPSHLMVLATFRSTEAAARKLGGLVAELALHGHCNEIALDPLGLDAIEAYLRNRVHNEACIDLRRMARLLLERTGGNPLFMTSVVDQLVQTRSVEPTTAAILSIPRNVRRFIERQIEILSDGERDLLLAASVVGREFATAIVASALEIDAEPVETSCMSLAERETFIVKAGFTAWPGGTRTELYSFRHDIYRELLYDRLTLTRRTLIHARVGRRLEVAWAGRLDEIAAELAEHFERANEPARAIPYHQRAAAKALRCSANEEAIGHLSRAFDIVNQIPDEADRSRIGRELHVALGAAYAATRGFGAPEVLDAYTRAEVLCEGSGEIAVAFPAIWGQWLFRWGRSEIETAWGFCGRLLALADKFGDTGFKVQAHHAAWATSFGRGELANACAHAQAGLALYDAELHQTMASSYGNHDASSCARQFMGLSLAFAGEVERARAMVDDSLAIARSLRDPFSLSLALYFGAAAMQVLGDVASATRYSEASRQLSNDYFLALPKAWSTGVMGWCAAETGNSNRGIALLTEAIADLRATGSRHFMCYLLGLLADVYLKAGDRTAAMRCVREGIAITEPDGERYYIAELYRLQGELLASGPQSNMEKTRESFRTAIDISTQQGSIILQRKASESLRLWFP